MSRLLEFKKLHNIRDLGGMKTLEGRVIRSGKMIRSGHLSNLDPQDAGLLGTMLDLVIDFRTAGEFVQQPDVRLPGIEYVSIPILDSLTGGITREKEADLSIMAKYVTMPHEAKEYMCKMYLGFAGEDATSSYRNFLNYLLEGREKGILWHCTAGKDRAGIGAVLIEEILGVPREEILADYLKTNEFIQEEIDNLKNFIRLQFGAKGEFSEEAIRYLFGADEAYLKSFYKALDERYGDFGNYLEKGLGLTAEDISLLKKKYLE